MNRPWGAIRPRHHCCEGCCQPVAECYCDVHNIPADGRCGDLACACMIGSAEMAEAMPHTPQPGDVSLWVATGDDLTLRTFYRGQRLRDGSRLLTVAGVERVGADGLCCVVVEYDDAHGWFTSIHGAELGGLVEQVE